jgi:hypothetical protein
MISPNIESNLKLSVILIQKRSTAEEFILSCWYCQLTACHDLNEILLFLTCGYSYLLA